jgi:hypothetical protein
MLEGKKAEPDRGEGKESGHGVEERECGSDPVPGSLLLY